MRDPVAHHTSTASVGVINEVLGQLIRTALTDEGVFTSHKIPMSI
jgi:hypothetical protein